MKSTAASSQVPQTDAQKRRGDPSRVVALTDAVVAIISTVLVLDLEAPDLSSGQSVTAALREDASTFVAFVVSFLLVAMYWVWHRRVFANVRYVNRNAVWLNILFLLPLSLVPLAAATLGKNVQNATALHLYGAILVAITLFRVLLGRYLNRREYLLWDPPNRRTRRMAGLTAAAPIVVYAAAIVVAAWLPVVSLVLYAALPLLYFLLVLFLDDDQSPQELPEARDSV